MSEKTPPLLIHAKPVRQTSRRQMTNNQRQSWPAWLLTIAVCLCGPPRESSVVELKEDNDFGEE